MNTPMLTSKQLVENIWVTLVARAAMVATPLLILLLSWFFSDIVTTQRMSLQILTDRLLALEAKVSALDGRVTVVEVDRKREQDNANFLRQDVLNRLDAVTRGQNETVAHLSALDATVKALKEQVDIGFRAKN